MNVKTQAQAVVKKTAAPAPMDLSNLEKFAGAGAENITSKDVSLPFLKIITNTSAYVTPGDAKFVDAARPGMVINTVLNKMYDGKTGFLAITCFFKFEYVEWGVRGSQDCSAAIAYYPDD